MDKTMVLWTLDTESDLWIEQVNITQGFIMCAIIVVLYFNVEYMCEI